MQINYINLKYLFKKFIVIFLTIDLHINITWFSFKTNFKYYWLSLHTWLLPLQNEL